MDDLLITQTNQLLVKFHSNEDLLKDLQALSKTLTSTSKPSTSKIQTVCIQFSYLKLFDELIFHLKGSPQKCVQCLKVNNDFLMTCSDPTTFLSRFLPLLTEIVTDDFLDNEEVHVVVCDLVFNLTSSLNSAQIYPVLNQLIPLLLELLENSFKTVKAKVCKCLNSLARSIPSDLQDYSKEIIESLLLCLKHPDFHVRLNTLDTLRTLAFIYSQSTFKAMFDLILAKRTEGWLRLLEFTQDNILSVVLRDEDSQVRKSFFTILCEWISKMPYKDEIESPLVAFLIFGLFDPVLDVRTTCWDLFDHLGVEWEQSHGCLNNTETLGDPRFQGIYPWHPFENRPRFGLRMLMLKHFEEAGSSMLLELANELSPYRETAAKLFFALLLMTEYVNEENAEKVILGLMAAVSFQENSKTQQLVFQSLELVGRFLPVRLYMKNLTSSRSSAPFFCMFLCISVKTVSQSSQIIALNYLVKGTLNKLQDELEENLDSIIRYIRRFERSKLTLQVIHTLIDSSYSFSALSKTQIFALLVEHEHESVPKYIKKIQETWYQLDLSHFNSSVQDLLQKVSSLGSSDWKNYTLSVIFKQWPVFTNLCRYCRDFIMVPNILPILVRIVNSAKSPYHIEAVRLMRQLNLHSSEAINSVIIKCLLGKVKTEDLSVLRRESLSLLKNSEHHNVEMSLFEALSACLDDPQFSVRLDACDEIHRQFTFVKIYGVEKFTKAKDQSNIVTKLMLKLICILEGQDDSMLNCLYPLIDVIGLFPEEIDINAKAWSSVLKRLVGIVMDEEKTSMECKELAHLCIIAVTNSNKKVIIDELTQIAKTEDKKVSEYIQSMLSSD